MKDEKTYEPHKFEKKLYKEWEDNGYFKANVNPNKKPYTIIMPPPNVTGQAHIGHAMDFTVQDILIRFKRMQGYEALWQPGADHAAIATESKLVEKLRAEGKTKEDIGREAFDKYAWDWYNFYGNRIMDQSKTMGFSADWDRYRFTMDEQSTKAVLTAFVNLFNKGLIYRGSRLTHWCTGCQSVISDDEVVFGEEESKMWYISYPFAESEGGGITVATTRPETMFGDTAVAVNPTDKRYKHLIGKRLKLPLTDRQIPIIADEYVDKSFGSGMVKITPAHDSNDYEVGKRHNLAILAVIGKDGKMNEHAPKAYVGLSITEARKKAVTELKNQKLLIREEKIKHSTPHCERCKTSIEPMVTEQWFVKMSEIVKPAIECIKDKTVKIYPKRFEINYMRWLENTRDWCISRQLWTGHRIPVYTCTKCGKVFASVEKPKNCEVCKGGSLKQDPDVLDTWFSSALWPFSTLGWPEKTPEMEYFYPTDCLVTAWDILTQWVTKMVYMGYECTGKQPFNNILIHGLVVDEFGKKMSKSTGNGVDPLEIVELHGADALRMTLIKDISMGMAIRFSKTKLDNSRAFINKLWNAAKFVAMHSKDETPVNFKKEDLSIADKWILNELQKTIKKVTNNLVKLDIGLALGNAHDFVWDKFCDWYIELAKPSIYKGDSGSKITISVLNTVLLSILKLLHPFIPYVTEYIYKQIKSLKKELPSLVISKFPEYDKSFLNGSAAETMEKIMEAIKEIRNFRKKSKIPENKLIDVICVTKEKEIVKSGYDYILKLCGMRPFEIVSGINDADKIKALTCLTGIAEFYIFTEEADKSKEKELITNQLAKIKFEVERSEKLLKNKGFTDKAPKSLVEEENKKLLANKKLYETIFQKFKSLK